MRSCDFSLPSSAASQVEAQRQPLVVLVDRAGNYYVGDSALVRNDLASLKDAIRQQAGNDTERTIVIQADAKATHQSVITAMDAIGQLGFFIDNRMGSDANFARIEFY